ncbi:MAG: Holliday junction branch migration DNA helicase RuvB [Pseudomonadota bacterium]
MPFEREIVGEALPDEAAIDLSLRPRRFEDFVGQDKVKDNLRVFVEAARRREEPVDHLLFCGPPGLGKTSLAHIVANEMGTGIHVTSGPALERKGDLAGILTNLGPGEVLFIDEIHRLNPAIEEILYPAMEDYRIDLVYGDGPHARTLTMGIHRFTLVGATTRTGLLSSPLRDRFGFVARLDYYAPGHLSTILGRSAGILGIAIDDGGATEIARRSRGTPRIANRLLRRVRDFAEVDGEGLIDVANACSALNRLDIDAIGLDVMDRRFLGAIIDKFDGGPVGIDSLAASCGEDGHTLEEVYEPYLIQQGFVQRTPRGRIATPHAYAHLGRRGSAASQGRLFKDHADD